MGAPKFQKYAEDNYGVIFTMKEAEQIRQDFFDTWDGLALWHARTRLEARKWGYVTTPIGRIRHLPLIFTGDDYQKGMAERQAINSPVQGLASDIMCLAAHRIRQHTWMRPVALVHDCVLVECPEDRVELGKASIKHAMEIAVLDDLQALGCDLSVPLVADITVGRNWS